MKKLFWQVITILISYDLFYQKSLIGIQIYEWDKIKGQHQVLTLNPGFISVKKTFDPLAKIFLNTKSNGSGNNQYAMTEVVKFGWLRYTIYKGK